MKTKLSTLQTILILSAATILLYFSSCSKQQVVTEKTGTQINDAGSNPDNLTSAGCSFPVYLITPVNGHRKTGSLDCTGNGLCYIQKMTKLDQALLCPKFKLPDCAKVDCNNPWNYLDIFEQPIIRYVDYFKGDPGPLPAFVPLKVTSNIAVLQFYAEVKGTLSKQVLTLPVSFSLPPDVAKNLDLNGSVIPAGTYPVVFDLKTKTLNAIVNVR